MPIDFPVSFLVSQKEGHSWTVRFETEGRYSVGLSAENEVALDAEGIFDQHLSTEITEDGIFVRPASPGAEFTFNGSYANISTLQPGDEIGLPGYTLTCLAGEEEAQNSPGHRVELSYIVSKPGPLSDASRAFPCAWFLAAGTVSICQPRPRDVADRLERDVRPRPGPGDPQD